MAVDHFQPLERIGLGQQRLLVGNLGGQLRGDGIGQLARHRRSRPAARRHPATELLVELGIFAELFDHAAHHRRDFGARGAFALQLARPGRPACRASSRSALQPPALLAFDQHPHRAIGQLEQLQHRGDDAHVIEIILAGIVAAGIKLGEQEDILVARHRRFQRRHRLLAANEQRHDHAGKNDDIAQGEEREEFQVTVRSLGRVPGVDAGYGEACGGVQWG